MRKFVTELWYDTFKGRDHYGDMGVQIIAARVQIFSNTFQISGVSNMRNPNQFWTGTLFRRLAHSTMLFVVQQTLLTAMKPDAIVDAGTQTSPPLSRSSSFTWVSTSSLLLHTDDDDDDNRSTSSSSSCSPQQSSSRDSLSDSPLGSVERDEPESGIGTASPPRSNKCAGRKSGVLV